ncbi:hypothetical protein [Roseovarius salinarum]|uniref:hypothetical protein n=1 Tax=Roseovarius salinarum TaxID=1981892 RepID=UPI0018E473AC|nr:hypothetical protein [Roseovarius salinarum]
MNPRWLFRMARWAQRPPSERRVKLVLGIVAACVALFVIERYVGWPDALSVEPGFWHGR